MGRILHVRQALVYSRNDRLWDPQGRVPSFVAGLLISQDENPGFVLKDLAHCIVAQLPNLGDFRNAVMTFSETPARGGGSGSSRVLLAHPPLSFQAGYSAAH